MTDEPKLDRKIVKWITVWAVWTLFGFFFASQVALQNQLSRNPVSFWNILSWQMVSGYVWFALSPLILYLAHKFPFETGKWKKSLPVHLAAGLIIALFQQAIDTFFFDAARLSAVSPIRQFSRGLPIFCVYQSASEHFDLLGRGRH